MGEPLFPYHTLTMGDLTDALRESLLDQFADELADGRTVDECLDRLDGSTELIDGQRVTLDLGNSTTSPVYRELVKLVHTARRELNS